MNNNDVLRRLRYTFDLDDSTMINIFKLADFETRREEISNWLKREDDPDFDAIDDLQMATFLNGFIILKRGKKEGVMPIPEKNLNNNLILRKLKIALNLRSDDILAIMNLADFRLSKHELSSFFRRKDHKHYQECKNQILRNFLTGLQEKYRAKK